MGNLNLGKVIKNDEASEHEAEIAALQSKAPYAQSFHNLNNGSNSSILKYDWIVGHEVVPVDKIPDDIYTIDSVKIGSKKKGSKKKAKKKEKKKGSSIYAKEIITLTGIMGASARKTTVEKVDDQEILKVDATDQPENLKLEDTAQPENLELDDTAQPEIVETPQEIVEKKVIENVPVPEVAVADKKEKAKSKKSKKKKKASLKLKAEKVKVAKKKSGTSNKKSKSAKSKKSSSKKKKKQNKDKGWRVFTEEQRIELNDFTTWLNSLASETGTKSKSVREEKSLKPKKSKGKKAKSSAMKSKKKDKISEKIDSSVIKKDEIVSESLAALYMQQGHHKKALKAYKRLSLINPEKSSFFAPLIEELKKKV